MKAKRAKKPSQPVRYLLFVDRTLKKISLRKVRERVTGTRTASRARARSTSVRGRPRRSGWLPLATSPRAIVLGVTGVLVGAALLTARQPSPLVDQASVITPPEIERTAADQAVRLQPSSSPSRKDIELPRSAMTVAPLPKPRPVSSVAAIPAPRRIEADRLAVPPPRREEPVREAPPAIVTPAKTEPAETTEAISTAASTITGCVESGDGTLWLADTSGADAPKARSWKSGFFKKRSVRVELRDASRTLHLNSYVGQRVSVTGALADRELRAQSIRRVNGSCD